MAAVVPGASWCLLDPGGNLYRLIASGGRCYLISQFLTKSWMFISDPEARWPLVFAPGYRFAYSGLRWLLAAPGGGYGAFNRLDPKVAPDARYCVLVAPGGSWVLVYRIAHNCE